MQPSDVLSRASRPPDLVLAYGEGKDRMADVRLRAVGDDVSAARPERSPLVIFIHGGFWRAAYDKAHTGPLAEALADSGFVVCTPEYRKVGQPGGGWPGTFEDIAAAMEVLPRLVADATDGRTDGSQVIIAGHSAGGHLALWAASREGSVARRGSGPGAGVAPGAAWRRGRVAVLSLAGVCELAGAYRQGLGNGAAGDLMGGGPEQFPERYAVADPMNLTPIGVPIALVHGSADDRVPWQQSQHFAAKAQASGDDVTSTRIGGCGHFEVIDPLSTAWPTVLAAFREAAASL
jgi:acetyl esterase/lipase